MIDIHKIKSQLEPIHNIIIIDLVPGGKLSGNEYTASSVRGGEGSSFSFNIKTGKWADFATNEKGGDIISLYAHQENVSQKQAAISLKDKYLSNLPTNISYPIKQEQPKISIIKPPINHAKPGMFNQKLGGEPELTHIYKDIDGGALFYVARYNNGGDKQFRPFSFQSDGRWVNKAWPVPRPLYNLDKIYADKDKPILIVEGEKSADAAEKLTKAYIVTTWPNGAQAHDKVDLTPLYNRDVLLWPDADEPGKQAMGLLSAKLINHVRSLKKIETDRADGWDAADALTEPGFKFQAWARPLVIQLDKPRAIELVDESDTTLDSQDEQRLPSNLTDLYIHLGLAMTDDRVPKVILNAENVFKILSAMPDFKGKLWYDSFYRRKFTTLFGENSRAWEDVDTIRVLVQLQSKFKLSKLTQATVFEAISLYAQNNVRSEPADYFNSLTWDGTQRISDFFIRACGAEDNEYTRAVSENMFTAIAARVLKPGCKFDNMVILEGKQGTYKSTVLREIIGDAWFSESSSALDNKDFEQSLVGKIIVEFDELDQFRKSDVNLIKKKLSTASDDYRPSYGRENIKVGRTCIFVGTTNQDSYLKDPTGARRFWPVRIELCDIEYTRANREQLLAEGVYRFKSGLPFHIVPKEQAEVEQAARYDQDEWIDIIDNYLSRQQLLSFKTSDIWVDCFQSDLVKLTKPEQNRIANALRYLGYNLKLKKVNGEVSRMWSRV